MASRSWVLVLVPALAFASLALAAYGYAVGNPLPWNEYGHTPIRVDSSLTVPAMSTVTVAILGDGVIPAKSFVWTMVYVATKGSDNNPVTAVFQFLYNGEEGAAISGWGMGQDFETRVETRGTANPQYVIENIQAFDIVVLENAWVTVPPTAADHFAMLLPWVVLIGSMVSFAIDAALVAIQRSRPRAAA